MDNDNCGCAAGQLGQGLGPIAMDPKNVLNRIADQIPHYRRRERITTDLIHDIKKYADTGNRSRYMDSFLGDVLLDQWSLQRTIRELEMEKASIELKLAKEASNAKG